MPPSKSKVIDQLAEVKNLGATFATRAYEDLGVRTIEDLVEAARAGKLQQIKGIGAAREKAILESAQALVTPAPAPTPEKKAPTTKKAPAKASKKEPAAKPAAAKKPTAAKKAPATTKKAETPKAEAPKAETPKAETPKAETPKAETPKAEAPKAEAPKAKPAAERPRTTYRPPEPKPRPSIPGLLFKLTKKIIGRLLG